MQYPPISSILSFKSIQMSKVEIFVSMQDSLGQEITQSSLYFKGYLRHSLLFWILYGYSLGQIFISELRHIISFLIISK